MKKAFMIALCCMALSFAACNKTDDPNSNPNQTEDGNYAPNYVGNYIGSFDFNITSMNNAPQDLPFTIDTIGMVITEGQVDNAITATVTVDNKTQQTTGTTTKEKASFEAVQFTLNEMHQLENPYIFNIDMLMEGTKTDSDTLNITGTFTGDGSFMFNGVEIVLDEVSGTMSGKLVKQ